MLVCSARAPDGCPRLPPRASPVVIITAGSAHEQSLCLQVSLPLVLPELCAVWSLSFYKKADTSHLDQGHGWEWEAVSGAGLPLEHSPSCCSYLSCPTSNHTHFQLLCFRVEGNWKSEWETTDQTTTFELRIFGNEVCIL